MQIKVFWTMMFIHGKGWPQPESFAASDSIKSYAKEHNVQITTERVISGGKEARIMFAGSDVHDLLHLSRISEKAICDHQYGLSSPVIPRRTFLGKDAKTMNVLLEQIDAFRETLKKVAPELEGGKLARGSGAIVAGKKINRLLEKSL